MLPYDIPPKIVYEEGGGINQGLPPSEIESNERVVIENFYAFGKKLIRRGGIRRVTSAPYTSSIDDFLSYRGPDVGIDSPWRIIVRGGITYGRTISPAADLIVNIPVAPAGLMGASDAPMFQYNSIIYSPLTPTTVGGYVGLARIDTNNPTMVMPAGIVAPTGAPTIAQGVAGALAAGNYRAVYTYFNSATGVESNPSPASNILALAAGFKIDYTVIADPPAGINQITDKRVYRTLINQVGEYYYVGTVALGVTILTEELLPSAMGDSVLFNNNLPPSNLIWSVPWNDRCFGTDGESLFMSNFFTMEGWTNEEIPIFKDEGHFVRVLYPWGKEKLIIGTAARIVYLTGIDPSSFRLYTLSDKYGCIAPYSMRSVENLLFWLGDKNVYMSDGTSTRAIGDVKVRDALDALAGHGDVPGADRAWMGEYATAVIFPSKTLYILAIPDGLFPGALHNRVVLVYNYRTDAWTIFRHPTMEPSYMVEVVDSGPNIRIGMARNSTIYATGSADRHLYRLYDPTRGYDEDVNAASTPILAKILTRQEDGGSLMAKALRRVHLLCTTAAESITLKAYRDGRAVPSASRDVSLNVDSAWKAANLSTLRDPGSTVQLGIEYTGTTAIEIEAEALELELVERFSGQPQ